VERGGGRQQITDIRQQMTDDRQKKTD